MKNEYKRIIGELLQAISQDREVSENDERIVLELIGDLKRVLYI